MKYVKICFEWLVFSNVFVAMAAVFMAWETLLIMEDPSASERMLRWIFFATLFIYIFQRLMRFKQFNEKASYRLKWMHQNRVLLILLAILSAGFTLEGALRWNGPMLVLLGIVGGISLLYAIPFIPDGGGLKMLRDVPFLKIFLISLVWTVVTVIFPLSTVSTQVILEPFEQASLIFQRFCFIFAITLPFDIRDLVHDRKAGLKTIPLLFGKVVTKRLSYFLLTLFAISAMVQYQCGDRMTLLNLVALELSVLLTAVIISFAEEGKPELFFSGLIEGTMILQFLLVWISEVIV